MYSLWSNGLYPLEGLEEAIWNDEAYFLELDRAGAARGEYVGVEAIEQAKRCFGELIWEEDKEVRVCVWDCLTGEVLIEQQF